ncbi:hypothetical protein TrVE_jg12447 [Triparma verrucosa]|uniref:EXS domain-containing protein n=1 Tax=Triparma verrucosa TaxID=1606542 RepID=A0A9W7EQ21_9STRA|nr:hypothetical protein TrVE_jg12447 [Triparma verrucosa]
MSQEIGNIFAQASREGEGLPHDPLLRSPTILILFIALWGIDVYVFHRLRLDWRKAMDLPSQGDTNGSNGSSSNNGNDCEDGDIELLRTSGAQHQQTSTASSDDDDTQAITPVPHEDDDDDDRANLLNHAVSRSSSGNRNSNSTNDISANVTSLKSSGADKILLLSASLFLLLYVTQFVCLNVLSGSGLFATISFYLLVFVLSLSTSPSAAFPRSLFFSLLEHLAAIATGGRDFLHVFLADALCSLSKIFFDLGLLFSLVCSYPHNLPTSSTVLLIPSLFASMPFLIRIRQCMGSYFNNEKNDGFEFMHILNSLKYASSILPIVISAFQHLHESRKGEEDTNRYEGVLQFFLCVNTLFCFTWDTVVDWGLGPGGIAFCEVGFVGSSAPQTDSNGQELKKKAVCLRQGLRLGSTGTWICVIANFSMRCAWVLRYFQTSLFKSWDQYVLAAQFIEVFRRAVWNVLRVENQLLQTRIGRPNKK